MRIHPSARKHGISDEDIEHALRNPIAAYPTEHEERSHRFLVLGPDRAGNFLELVVAVGDGDLGLVIHAMRMRRRYHDLLPRHVD